MSTEENKALARRFHGEVFSQGNMAALDEICDANWVYHDPSDPEGRWPHGPQGARQLVNTYRTAFPDLQVTYEDQIAEGDKVVSRWTARGTHTGDLMGIPPTGKQMTLTGITIMRIAGGQIQEDWGQFDALGMFQQLGVIPPMG
jgi:steroid delta-isomerase-like uncharacterized protein